MKAKPSTNLIARTLFGFAVPALIAGTVAGQRWFGLGLQDSERWANWGKILCLI